jgi:phage antirepressor YoqD-like protein
MSFWCSFTGFSFCKSLCHNRREGHLSLAFGDGWKIQNRFWKDLSRKTMIMRNESNYTTLFRMNEVAKILDLGFGRNTLLSILRVMKILDSANTTFQSYVDRGYFKLVVKPRFAQPNRFDLVTLVTEKGLDFLRRVISEDSGSSYLRNLKKHECMEDSNSCDNASP